MRKRFLKRFFKRRTRAFTLIELTIAAGIVAGAAGSYRGAMDIAKRSVCQQNLRQVGQLLFMYEMSNGHLPDARFYPQDAQRDPRSISRIVPELQPLLVCPSMPHSLAERGITFIWNDACSGKSISSIRNPRRTWLLMTVSALDDKAPHLGGYNILYADCQTTEWVREHPELVAAGADRRQPPRKVPLKEAPGMKHPDFDIRSPALEKIIAPDSRMQKLAGGMKFTEGPVWIPQEGHLLFSDIMANQIKRWSPKDKLSTWRENSGQANGNALDRQGRLITCEHRSRRISRTEKDGKVVTLADDYQGKKLNSPNDVAVKSDGSIWFTDPPYGIRPEQKELPANYVFRLDLTNKLTVVASDFDRPNGLCFSPDYKKLYIADTNKDHVRVFDVTADNRLLNGKVFAQGMGRPDGMTMDTDGRLYVAGDNAIYVYDPQGLLLGRIKVPSERPANCTFGGEDDHTLFITARPSLYAIKLAATGVQQPGPGQPTHDKQG